MYILRKNEILEFVRQRRQLFDAAGQQNPFACSAWVLHFIEQVAESTWTFVVPECLVDGESLMLLYSELGKPNRLRALTNYYASLYSPLITTASDRKAAGAALIRQLAKLRPLVATVNLAPMDRESGDFAAVRHGFYKSSWYLRRYFCFGNWYLPCGELSFHEYMKQRPSRLYNTWIRKARKFAPGTNVRLEIITDPANLGGAIKAYQSVYAKSWKDSEPYPQFVPEWAKICAANGWLRLGLAWVDDVPIAAQFWFTLHRRAYIYKLAYDDQYAKWSAGTVLTAHMIKHSFEHDGVIEIDYLTGDDAYKRSWMTHRRERVGLLACNLQSPRGIIAAAVELGGEIRQRWHARLRSADSREGHV